MRGLVGAKAVSLVDKAVVNENWSREIRYLRQNQEQAIKSLPDEA
jgi:hypothetical protein